MKRWRKPKKYMSGVQKVEVRDIQNYGGKEVAAEAAAKGIAQGDPFSMAAGFIAAGAGGIAGAVGKKKRAKQFRQLREADVANNNAVMEQMAMDVNPNYQIGGGLTGKEFIAKDGANVQEDKKLIEVEKNELVFRKTDEGIKLVKDFKRGDRHEEGGEPYVAKQGDIIIPAKDRDKILKMVNPNSRSLKPAYELEFKTYISKLPADIPEGGKAMGGGMITSLVGGAINTIGSTMKSVSKGLNDGTNPKNKKWQKAGSGISMAGKAITDIGGQVGGMGGGMPGGDILGEVGNIDTASTTGAGVGKATNSIVGNITKSGVPTASSDPENTIPVLDKIQPNQIQTEAVYNKAAMQGLSLPSSDITANNAVMNDVGLDLVPEAVPRFEDGGVVPPDYQAMAKVINNRNKDKSWVNRAISGSHKRIKNSDGTYSTHKLAYRTGNDGEAYVYPTIIEDKSGNLVELEDSKAWELANKNKNYIRFDDSKFADWYSKNGLINHNEPKKYALGVQGVGGDPIRKKYGPNESIGDFKGSQANTLSNYLETQKAKNYDYFTPDYNYKALQSAQYNLLNKEKGYDSFGFDFNSNIERDYHQGSIEGNFDGILGPNTYDTHKAILDRGWKYNPQTFEYYKDNMPAMNAGIPEPGENPPLPPIITENYLSAPAKQNPSIQQSAENPDTSPEIKKAEDIKKEIKQDAAKQPEENLESNAVIQELKGLDPYGLYNLGSYLATEQNVTPETQKSNKVNPALEGYTDRSEVSRNRLRNKTQAQRSVIARSGAGNAQTAALAAGAADIEEALGIAGINAQEAQRADAISSRNVDRKNRANEINTQTANRDIETNAANRAAARNIERQQKSNLADTIQQTKADAYARLRDEKLDATQRKYLRQLITADENKIKAMKERDATFKEFFETMFADANRILENQKKAKEKEKSKFSESNKSQ